MSNNKGSATVDQYECQGIQKLLATDAAIKEIKDMAKGLRDMIGVLTADSTRNKVNLENLTASFKDLAESNSLTHYNLFAKTENLRVGHTKTETVLKEHIGHGNKSDDNKRHRSVFIVSCIAIGISLLTVIILAIQAGMFTKGN
jgi:hypothetical protein